MSGKWGFWNIQVLDPETKDIVHVCNHTVGGYSTKDAIRNFKSGYSWKSAWLLKAKKTKKRRDL